MLFSIAPALSAVAARTLVDEEVATERCPWNQSEMRQFLASASSGGAGPAFPTGTGKDQYLQIGLQRLQEMQAGVYYH
jgi:hypothetical protein